MRRCDGCRSLVPVRQPCPTCNKTYRAKTDQVRQRRVDRSLYRTEKWKQYSRNRLSEHPFCVGYPLGCHGTVGVVAYCTDHIKPASYYPELFFDPDNHQSLCKDCNERKGDTWMDGKRSPTTGQRFVIIGPPNSGKTTWVQERARQGIDLVWDLDAIAGALAFHGNPVPRVARGQLPWAVMKASLTMRDALVGWLCTTTLYEADCYIIATNTAEASLLASMLNAQLVHLEAKAKVESAKGECQ